MNIKKPNTLIKFKKNQLIIANILSIIIFLFITYLIFKSDFLTDGFKMQVVHNNFFTYFIKLLVIFIGIYCFTLAVVLHNKYTLTLFCYCYLMLLFFLFFIKGAVIDAEPQEFVNLGSMLKPDFSSLFIGLDDYLNFIMPIPLYAILTYIFKYKGRAFLIGIILIVLIEPIQLITNLGAFDSKDFHQNMLGYLLGCLIYLILYYIYKNKKENILWDNLYVIKKTFVDIVYLE